MIRIEPIKGVEPMWLISDAEKKYFDSLTEYVGRNGVAKIWGISVSRLSEKPWLIPMGELFKGKRNAKWATIDIENMKKKGEAKCKEEYFARIGNQ